jgi:hypothetical protein
MLRRSNPTGHPPAFAETGSLRALLKRLAASFEDAPATAAGEAGPADGGLIALDDVACIRVKTSARS